MQLVSSNHPHIKWQYTSYHSSLSRWLSAPPGLSTFNLHPSKCRLICKFVLKHTSSFSNIICEFSNIFPSSLASSWLAGWRRVSARGKWVDTSPNYSPPEDLCYPPTNKLTKFSSPAHATHCAPASLGLVPTFINSEQTSLVILFTHSQSWHQGKLCRWKTTYWGKSRLNMGLHCI